MKNVKITKQKIRGQDEWILRIEDDDGEYIGSIVIGRWMVKEDQNFRVHVHSYVEGGMKIQKQTPTHISIYPSLP